MERCPNCRARHDGNSVCRRCGMELGLLLDTERAADELLHEACLDLAAGQRQIAWRALSYSLALKREPLAELVRAFIEHEVRN